MMAASALAPGISHARAVAAIARGVSDPVLGPVSIDEVQLCPQHSGKLHEELIDELMETHPGTRFRIHATPRVSGGHHHRIVDAANASEHPEQMARTAALSRRMCAPGYSLHAGRRDEGTLEKAFNNVRRLEDLFQCPVGIEGLYPSTGPRDTWLLSRWSEHERLLESGVHYAIDLSHLLIVARRERDERPDLVEALVSSPRCIEVHVSDNEARLDSHRPLTPGKPVWWMRHMQSIVPTATLFYEGILVDPRRRDA